MAYPIRSRRRRSSGGVNPVESRYFTELSPAAMQYYTSATVSPDTITMDVYPKNGNSGLPTGAPAVTDNVWQTISFSFAGSISEWGKNGANYFDGFIANIAATSLGVIVASSRLDQPGTTADYGQFTAINGSPADLFTQDEFGVWLSMNKWDDSVASVSGDGFMINGDGSYTHTGASLGEVRVGGVLVEGAEYRARISSDTDGGVFQFGGPQITDNRISPVLAGVNSKDLFAESTSVINAIRIVSSVGGVTYSAISAYRLLRVS